MKRICTLLLTILLVVSLAVPMAVFAEVEENPSGGEQGTEQQTDNQENTGGNGGSGSQGSQPQNTGGSEGSSDNSGGSAQSQNNSGGNSQNQGNSGGSSNSNDNNNNDRNDERSTGNDTTNNSKETTTKKKKTTQKKSEVSFIFTSDIHSHLDGIDGVGGFPRLKTQIDEIKDDYPESFIFDAGDFSMGTAFQTIFRSEASELKMMGQLDYDVVAFGNHDFDYGPDGTAKMLNTAEKAREIKKTEKRELNEKTRRYVTLTTYDQVMPSLVVGNIDWQATLADEELSKEAKKLKKAMDKYGVSDYTVVEKNGVRVAVFGLVGEEAQSQSSYAGIKWSDPIKRAEEIVGEIKRNDEADMIVCLSHSGYTEEDGSSSEDARLAEEVSDIDVIVSGHAHTALKEPVIVNDTYIVAAGQYTEHVGNLVLKKKDDSFGLKRYRLFNLDKSVKKDGETQSEVNRYKDKINEKYFSKYGFTYGEKLADNKYKFPTLEKFEEDREDNNLGNIVADSFIFAVKKAEGDKYEKVDVAIVPSNSIHGTIGKGKVTASELFTVCSMGMGEDGKAGYPLVTGYITGKELKRVAEIDASIAKSTPSAILNVSGMSYGFNDRRLYLNRAVDMELVDGDKRESIDNGKLYRVVVGLKACNTLEIIDKKSKGLLSIILKDRDGNEIKDFAKHIVKHKDKEVKEWYALAQYIDSFEGGDIPAKYEGSDGRVRNETSLAPWAIVKQPNNYGVILAALIMIPIVILIGIILYIRKRRYQRRGYEKTMFGEGRRQRRSIFKSKRMGISKGKRNRY